MTDDQIKNYHNKVVTLGILMQSMNYFDVNFCREHNADLAFAKMIIDCELHYRLYKPSNPDSGFIQLNGEYWYKFNIESICQRYTLFHKEKLLGLINDLFECRFYTILGTIKDEEILILLEE